jgi:hypothetical protein
MVADKTWMVCFRGPQLESQLVVAASAKMFGDHLVFLDEDGKLRALFLLEVVERWDEPSS